MNQGRIHNQRWRCFRRASIASSILVAGAALAATPVDESKLPPPVTAKVDFTRDIKPIFEQSCLRCHGTEKPKSRFRLDNREDALKGGENGVAIVPGKSGKSSLIHFVAGLDEDMQMPPKGKGDPLTPAQIGLLRAWIDQDVPWETLAPQPKIELAMAPTASWTTVSGDEKKFREHRWVREGWNGGVERFELQDKLGKDAKATIEGRALRDDYRVTLTLEKRDLGFTGFGFEQFRKYFDDSGGYYPGFTPSVLSLDRDLHLDQGRAWAEIGLILPDWPRMVLGYEYLYREGDKSTLQWGSVTGNGVTKNIYPASKYIDEQVHVVRFDLDHEVKGYRIEDNFRGEFYDLKTSRLNTRAYTAGSAGPSRLDDVGEHTDYFHGANAFRLEKSLTDWWLASAGYLYSKLDADATFRLDPVFPLGSPSPAERWRTPELVIERETHTFNATSLLGPWHGFTLTAGVLCELTRQEGLGSANLDFVFPTGFVRSNSATISSSYDRVVVDESLALRYAVSPFTTLFAEARLRQENTGENEEQQGGPYAFHRDTEVSSFSQDLRAGFNTKPWQKVSFGAHYRRIERDVDFDKELDQNAAGHAYPEFIRWRGVETDEVEVRVTAQPRNWLKAVLSYKYVTSEYESDTDAAAEAIPGDASIGGRLTTAHYDAHVCTFNATLTPWRRLYLSGTFSYQNTSMAAFASDSPSVVPYRGDVFNVLASANYAVSKATDFTATYSFSWADYEQNNFTYGLPVGLRYQQHGLVAGFSRRLTQNISTRLQYGFFYYDEPSTGGANNYTAHAVFATMVVRML